MTIEIAQDNDVVVPEETAITLDALLTKLIDQRIAAIVEKKVAAAIEAYFTLGLVDNALGDQIRNIAKDVVASHERTEDHFDREDIEQTASDAVREVLAGLSKQEVLEFVSDALDEYDFTSVIRDAFSDGDLDIHVSIS